MQEVFANPEYCKDELTRIREAWGNKTKFTSKTIDVIRETLAWMFLYCPIEMQPIVEAHLEELSRREWYALIMPKAALAAHEEGEG